MSLQKFVLYDSRWRWRLGTVTGAYNVLLPNGTIDPVTEKTLAELATILFAQMGEATPNVTALAGLADRPYVVWDEDVAADELMALLAPRGYNVSLLNNNTPKVVRIGTGTALPDNDDVMSVSISVDPPEIPEILRVVGDTTMVQSMLLCAAVGKDTDGAFKLAKDLSYNPGGVGNATGWDNTDMINFSMIANPDERILAKQTVGKCYQIQSQADGTQNISHGSVDYVPGEITVTTASQLLPIKTFLLETETDIFGNVRNLTPVVLGLTNPLAQQMPPNPNNTSPFFEYKSDTYTLVNEFGMVVFNDPELQVTGGVTKFADVYLKCAYAIHDATIQVKDHYVLDRNLGGIGTVTDHIDTYQRKLIVEYTAGTTTISNIDDNQADVDTSANNYLDLAVYRYTTQQGNLIFYRDCQNFDTDGVTWQLQWSIAKGDNPVFGTQASQNCEMIPFLPPSDEILRVLYNRRQGSPTNRRNHRWKKNMFGNRSVISAWP